MSYRANREKTPTKTIQSVATARTVTTTWQRENQLVEVFLKPAVYGIQINDTDTDHAASPRPVPLQPGTHFQQPFVTCHHHLLASVATW